MDRLSRKYQLAFFVLCSLCIHSFASPSFLDPPGDTQNELFFPQEQFEAGDSLDVQGPGPKSFRIDKNFRKGPQTTTTPCPKCPICTTTPYTTTPPYYTTYPPTTYPPNYPPNYGTPPSNYPPQQPPQYPPPPQPPQYAPPPQPPRYGQPPPPNHGRYYPRGASGSDVDHSEGSGDRLSSAMRREAGESHSGGSHGGGSNSGSHMSSSMKREAGESHSGGSHMGSSNSGGHMSSSMKREAGGSHSESHHSMSMRNIQSEFNDDDLLNAVKARESLPNASSPVNNSVPKSSPAIPREFTITEYVLLGPNRTNKDGRAESSEPLQSHAEDDIKDWTFRSAPENQTANNSLHANNSHLVNKTASVNATKNETETRKVSPKFWSKLF